MADGVASMTDALLPCPFCGEKPVVTEDDTYAGCAVSCSCDAEPCVSMAIGHLEKAIAAWNRRADAAEIAALKARVGELEAKLAKATPWEQICRRCGIRDSWKPDNDPQF